MNMNFTLANIKQTRPLLGRHRTEESRRAGLGKDESWRLRSSWLQEASLEGSASACSFLISSAQDSDPARDWDPLLGSMPLPPLGKWGHLYQHLFQALCGDGCFFFPRENEAISPELVSVGQVRNTSCS